MSDATTSTKLEQTGEIFWDSRGCLSARVCVGLPCSCADCKILIPPFLFKFSNSILDWTSLQWNFGEIFLKTFLEGSVDRVIARDYVVNRRFFIYCSLASANRFSSVLSDRRADNPAMGSGQCIC